MTDEELLQAIEQIRSIMISVATGGPQIATKDADYRALNGSIGDALRRRGIKNPIPFSDLWQWHGRWSSGDLPTYRSRRTHVAEMIDPLMSRFRYGVSVSPEPTGWMRVDRAFSETRERLATATNEEQYQGVGLLCREVLISVAQEVFDPKKHPIADDVQVSSTDFKRMIEAYIAVELRGKASEETRKHARSALDLALRVQHLRTAAFRDAAICVEATGAVVNIIAILSGRRDP